MRNKKVLPGNTAIFENADFRDISPARENNIGVKESKHLPDKKILYGLWEWGVRQ